MAAKIASDLKKPDGFVEVTKEGLFDFLWPLSIDKIWGVGKKSMALLNRIGIKTVGDLAKRDIKEVERLLGKNGVHLWELSNGIDQRDVETSYEAKSVGNELTFNSDTSDTSQIKQALMSLSEKVSGRLREDGIVGRTITLKVSRYLTSPAGVTLSSLETCSEMGITSSLFPTHDSPFQKVH